MHAKIRRTDRARFLPRSFKRTLRSVLLCVCFMAISQARSSRSLHHEVRARSSIAASRPPSGKIAFLEGDTTSRLAARSRRKKSRRRREPSAAVTRGRSRASVKVRRVFLSRWRLSTPSCPTSTYRARPRDPRIAATCERRTRRKRASKPAALTRSRKASTENTVFQPSRINQIGNNRYNQLHR